MVADALSRLDKDEMVPHDSLELYYSIIHAFDAEIDDLALHPISYAKLDIAQQADPQLKQKLKDDKYHLEKFIGARLGLWLVTMAKSWFPRNCNTMSQIGTTQYYAIQE